MKKDLAYYRSLPYTLRVTRFVEEEDGETYFCASYDQIPHVKGVHEERLLAVRLAKELFDAYIEAQLAWGQDIPVPDSPRFRKPGGQFKMKRHDVASRSEATPEVTKESFPKERQVGAEGGYGFQYWPPSTNTSVEVEESVGA